MSKHRNATGGCHGQLACPCGRHWLTSSQLHPDGWGGSCTATPNSRFHSGATVQLLPQRPNFRVTGCRTTPARRGFTLIEMLLVLALVVIVSALAWPMLQRPFAGRRLYAGADVVRTGWRKAHNEAVRSGHTYAFRYVPEGDRCCVQVEPDPDSGALPDGSGLDGSMTPADDELNQPVEMKLPEGVKFLGGDTSGDAAATADSGADLPPDGDASWSEPILFYPDGTTSDAHLLLGNEYGSSLEVTLRGLTGVVTTGEVVATGG